MIKVLIADFDSDTCKNFRTYIKLSFQQNFRVVKTVETNKDFIKVLTESGADLVIADIKFLGTLALRTLNDVSEVLPNIRFILYGMYDDSDYLQKSMDFNCIQYMFKPVKPADLDRCLQVAEKVLKDIEQKNEENKYLLSLYDKNLVVFEDRFLINLIHGHLESEREIKKSFEYFNINIIPDYTVFIVKVDNFRQIILTLEEKEKQLMIFNVLLKINTILDELKNGKAFINHFNAVTVIVGGSLSFQEMYDLATRIKEFILKNIRIEVTIGIGNSYNKATEIPVSYKQAKAALRYTNIFGSNAIIPIDYAEPSNNITYRYPLKKEELLVYTTVVGDFSSAEKRLLEIMEALKACGTLPDKLLPKIILDILISINRNASEQNVELDDIFSKFFSVRVISGIKTLEEAYHYLHEMILNTCEYIKNNQNNRDHKIYNEVKQFVLDRYFENLTLFKMAYKFNCTPDYLNRLFLEKEKKSFYDFVILSRLDVAKRLIAESGSEIDDENIAYRIGYEDIKYFRSIFRQYVGINITDYRNMNKK